jgi:hypothetical protein
MDYPKEMSEEESRYYNATINLNIHGYLYRPIDSGKIIKFIKTKYFYDKKNAEMYSTSAVSIYQEGPTDYTYMSTSGDIGEYTKVGEYQKAFDSDNIWDGKKENIDPDDFVFKVEQEVIDAPYGIGEYPDGGAEEITSDDYTFNDGTYADGQDV